MSSELNAAVRRHFFPDFQAAIQQRSSSTSDIQTYVYITKNDHDCVMMEHKQTLLYVHSLWKCSSPPTAPSTARFSFENLWRRQSRVNPAQNAKGSGKDLLERLKRVADDLRIPLVVGEDASSIEFTFGEIATVSFRLQPLSALANNGHTWYNSMGFMPRDPDVIRQVGEFTQQSIDTALVIALDSTRRPKKVPLRDYDPDAYRMYFANIQPPLVTIRDHFRHIASEAKKYPDKHIPTQAEYVRFRYFAFLVHNVVVQKLFQHNTDNLTYVPGSTMNY